MNKLQTVFLILFLAGMVRWVLIAGLAILKPKLMPMFTINSSSTDWLLLIGPLGYWYFG